MATDSIATIAKVTGTMVTVTMAICNTYCFHGLSRLNSKMEQKVVIENQNWFTELHLYEHVDSGILVPVISFNLYKINRSSEILDCCHVENHNATFWDNNKIYIYINVFIDGCNIDKVTKRFFFQNKFSYRVVITHRYQT